MPESENTETPPVEIPEIAKTPDRQNTSEVIAYSTNGFIYYLLISSIAASGIIATFAFDST